VAGDPPRFAGESLGLIERQQREVRRQLGVNPALIYSLRGGAYLLGFGVVFLTYPSAGLLRLPWVLAGAIIGVLLAAAPVVSIVTGERADRGVRGPSRAVGAMYGWSWTLGFCTLGAVNTGVTRLELPHDAVTLLSSGRSLRFQYGLGLWMLVTAASSVFVGVAGNFAVVSLTGGGGLPLATSRCRTRASPGWRGYGRVLAWVRARVA
jgi:hypothetical protein